MNPIFKRAGLAVRWGFLGLISGLLSCAMSESRILYIAREHKTIDHIVWPGIVFALVVLLPMSRWAGDGWLRTAAALIASSAVYPIAWRTAAMSIIGHSGAFMNAAFAFAGFLGSFVLASVLLIGRPRWARSAFTAVVLGTVVGGLMGASLRAAMTGVQLPFGLGFFMVLWQVVVAASLGRGLQARPNQSVKATGSTENSGDAPLGN